MRVLLEGQMELGWGGESVLLPWNYESENDGEVMRFLLFFHWIKFDPGNFKLELFSYFSKSEKFGEIHLVGLCLYSPNL